MKVHYDKEWFANDYPLLMEKLNGDKKRAKELFDTQVDHRNEIYLYSVESMWFQSWVANLAVIEVLIYSKATTPEGRARSWYRRYKRELLRHSKKCDTRI